jgi:predicted PurR-regulated permease PerM
LVEQKKWNKSGASTLIIVLSFLVIILPFLALSLMVIGKIASIDLSSLPIQVWQSKVNEFTGEHINQQHFFEDTVAKLGNYATELFPSIIGSAVNIILTLVVMYFLLFFMFTQIYEFEATMLKYAPFREQYSLKFAIELRDSTYSNVLGQGLIALVQGALLANGFWLAGLPDPIFWGIIGVFLSFLPIIGAPTLTIPASVILFANDHPIKGLLLLAYGVLFIGNIDNVLRLIINKRMANTHPLISVIGVFIGLPLFGILGLVFGPLLLSYFLLLVEIYETNRLAADRLDRIRGASES